MRRSRISRGCCHSMIWCARLSVLTVLFRQRSTRFIGTSLVGPQRHLAGMTRYCDWRRLPFQQVWALDTEYYPGPGYRHGGRDGDPITPLCVVALEMRTGKVIRLWQDELGLFPPYRLDADAVIFTYLATAEF